MPRPRAEIPVFGPAKNIDPGGPTKQLSVLVDSLSNRRTFTLGAVYTDAVIDIDRLLDRISFRQPAGESSSFTALHRQLLVVPKKPNYTIGTTEMVYQRVDRITRKVLEASSDYHLDSKYKGVEGDQGLYNPYITFREEVGEIAQVVTHERLVNVEKRGFLEILIQRLPEPKTTTTNQILLRIYNLNEVRILPSQEYLDYLMDLAQRSDPNWRDISERIKRVAPFPLSRFRERMQSEPV